MKYNKSYLKWAGGKGKALSHVLPVLEKHKKPVFAEPFIGAANVSLNFQADKYIWNDFNEDLIDSHATILGKLDDFYYFVAEAEDMFRQGHEEYLNLRDLFNSGKVKTREVKSALFLYLNKHGFNGLCRYNKQGKFNVPVGSSTKTQKQVPANEMVYFRDRFENKVDLYNEDFEEMFKILELQDEVLILNDPPYVPMGESNFNYTADGFGFEKQQKLKDLAKNSKHTVVISNHWNKITKELYKDADEVYTFPVQRTISCKGNERLPVEECVVVYKGL